MTKDKQKKIKGLKFVLSVGDEGAILTLLNKNRLIKRQFINSPTSVDLENVLNDFSYAPVSILVDVVDQSYIKHTMPPVSSGNVKKLANRKLAKDFSDDDLKAAIPLGREKTGKKEWNYLFVSARYITPLSDWIEAVSNTSNPFQGIFLLPLECMNHLKDYKKIVFKTRKEEAGAWQIIVSHNRIGGFRQMVFHDEKMIFTRIAQPIGGQEAQIIAGHIEQETQNTVEYIRRLGFAEEDGLDLFIITSGDVKSELNDTPFNFGERFILTPHEIGESLNLKAAEPGDKFGDVILAAQFSSHKKPILPLQTDYSKKIKSTQASGKILTVVFILGALGLLGLGAKSAYDTQEIQQNIEVLTKQNNITNQKLQVYKDFKSLFGEDAERIKELTEIDKKLSTQKHLLHNFISKYVALNSFDISVKEFSITKDRNNDSNEYISANFIIDFLNSQNTSLVKLLDEIDRFTISVKESFSNYDVSFADLPSQNQIAIDLENPTDANQMTVSLKISGPNPKDTNKKRR